MRGYAQPDLFDRDREEALNQIVNIGPTKPVGYLPLETVVKYCDPDIYIFVLECQLRGHQTRLFYGPEWPGFSGCLYVYDEAALQDLLDKNSSTLLAAHWPLDANSFVANLYINVPVGTELFKLIARAFGDRISENM